MQQKASPGRVETKAVIINTGNEILDGQILNTNATSIANFLNKINIEFKKCYVVVNVVS